MNKVAENNSNTALGILTRQNEIVLPNKRQKQMVFLVF